jgi:hypothetical protein
MATNHTSGACIVVGVALLLSASAYAATTPTQKCQEAKLRAQGKLELCLKRNSARVLVGMPDESTICQGKFQATLSKVEQIAVAAGTTACRYVDNGDGTVSELNTGLQWEQKDQSGGIHDWNNRYSWCNLGSNSCTDSSNPPDGTAFTQFLATLNNGHLSNGTSTADCFAGHCDWRLPTIEELAGILDHTQASCPPRGGGPCIDPVFGPTQSWVYWSETTNAPPGDTEFAWNVNFYGYLARGFKGASIYVRAVRGGL